MKHRFLKWGALAALVVLAVPVLIVLAVAVFGLNWARVPLQNQVLQSTGRALRIGGDLKLAWAWPTPRLRAVDVSFANPAWAAQPQMLVAEAVEITIDLRALLHGALAFPEVLLTRPRVFLEQASGGRKTWLLDRLQSDENMRIPIGHLLLDRGEVTYTEVAQKTEVRATLSTVDAPMDAANGNGDTTTDTRRVAFGAQGVFKGQPLSATGSGGGVLAWRDESRPYPLRVEATLGRTSVRAEGTVTSLLKLSAVDVLMALSGDSLASLYPLIGVALPPTPPYRSSGHLLRSGKTWRYENFTARFGLSDLAGRLQVTTGGAHTLLGGALVSQHLDLADLGPVVGARDKAHSPAASATPAVSAAPAAASEPIKPDGRVLPDLPFDTARWQSLDADVTLAAQTLLRNKSVTLEKLNTRIVLKQAQLTLDPLDFALAGGQVKAQLTLDGRNEPLHGHLKAQLRGLLLGRLLQTDDPAAARAGRLDGDLELKGQGASVGRLLASADGRLSLVAQNGQISRLLMEMSGLHLLEILQLKLSGDQTVALNCAVVDFGVAKGVMQARALVLDTAVNTLVGSGQIDLAQEKLDLTVVPHTKKASLVALRGPVYIKGSLGKPAVSLDAAGIATRGAGAVLLGLVNPLLALVPLFEAGPGLDSECARLVREARAPISAQRR